MQFRKTPIAVAALALFGALPLFAQAQSTPAPSSGALDVWFKAPRNGNTVSGALSGPNCYVGGSGPIARVAFTVDGGAVNTDSTPADGMQCSLDTTKLANGTHSLRADAYDSSGNRRSDIISINVQNTAVNTPPTVSMTGPSSGVTYSGNLSYSASATDNGGVARVDFFLDASSTALLSDATAPYGGTIDTTQLANGTHTIKAVAYDAQGLSASSLVSFNVSNNKAPTVSITGPSAGQTYLGTLGYSATATDDNAVARVDFFLDGSTTALLSDTTVPYGGTIDTTKLANGTHTLRAVAYDAQGLNASSQVSFNVNNVASTTTSSSTGTTSTTSTTSTPGPIAGTLDVWFKAPAVGATVSGVLNGGTSCYTNTSGTPSRVVFTLDGAAVNTDSTPADGTQCLLDTTKFANGTHTLRADAYDASGSLKSDVRSINIQNAATSTTSTGTTTGTVTGTTTGSTTGTVTGTTTGSTTGTVTGTTTGSTTTGTTTSTTSTPAPIAGALDVWFKAPAAGSTIKGVLSGGTSCYSNSSGSVARVVYMLDATTLNTDSTPADGTQCALDTTKFANGTHQLKAVAYDSLGNAKSDVISVNVQNAVSSTTTGSTGTTSTGSTSTGSTASTPANLLFWSGYESGVSLNTPYNCYSNGCYQQLTGTDSSTGFAWPFSLLGGTNQFQMISNSSTTPTSGTIGSWLHNEIRQVVGHKGNQTNALYSEVSQSGCCGTNPQGGGSTQDAHLLQPASDASDIYISKWIMLQPDLLDNLHAGDSWRSIFEWKEGTSDTGDFRISLQIVAYNNTPLTWMVMWDNLAGPNPHQEYYRKYNTAVPVPVGQWFKLEVFWHRGTGTSGRTWFAVNGQVIDDHFGTTIGATGVPVGRIFNDLVYSGGVYPIYQWTDDVQVWQGFPTVTSSDAWYDPPYAPH